MGQLQKRSEQRPARVLGTAGYRFEICQPSPEKFGSRIVNRRVGRNCDSSFGSFIITYSLYKRRLFEKSRVFVFQSFRRLTPIRPPGNLMRTYRRPLTDLG